MGVIGESLVIFLLSIILLIVAFVKKSRVLKVISIVGFVVSIGLLLLVWGALGHM